MARKLIKGLRLLRDSRYRRGLAKGVAATLEHQAALKPYRFATIIDVGANRGQFTLLMAGLCPDAAILAFEPLAAPYRKLVEATSNMPKVQAVNSAIGTLRGSVSMNVASRDDSSSLLPITELQTTIFPHTGHAGTEEVRIAPLGDFLTDFAIARPSLLKVDVQGYELEVLKGAEDDLDRFDAVYVEASFLQLYEGQPLASEVIDALRGKGFRMTAIHNLAHARDGRAVQADFLFERR